MERAPAGADTTAVVGKTDGGGFLWWRGAVGKGRGKGPLWVVEGRGEGLDNGEGRGRGERLLLERALLRQ